VRARTFFSSIPASMPQGGSRCAVLAHLRGHRARLHEPRRQPETTNKKVCNERLDGVARSLRAQHKRAVLEDQCEMSPSGPWGNPAESGLGCNWRRAKAQFQHIRSRSSAKACCGNAKNSRPSTAECPAEVGEELAPHRTLRKSPCFRKCSVERSRTAQLAALLFAAALPTCLAEAV
jgi:hypothetical protein